MNFWLYPAYLAWSAPIMIWVNSFWKVESVCPHVVMHDRMIGDLTFNKQAVNIKKNYLPRSPKVSRSPKRSLSRHCCSPRLGRGRGHLPENHAGPVHLRYVPPKSKVRYKVRVPSAKRGNELCIYATRARNLAIPLLFNLEASSELPYQHSSLC